MAKFMIACSMITWGRETPLEQMLAEIAQAGYEGAPEGSRHVFIRAKDIKDE